MPHIESRSYSTGERHESMWLVVVDMVDDPDTVVGRDGDWATEADREAWRRDDWQYVTMTARVHLLGVEIGTSSIGGVVYGALGDGRVADAWEWVPAEYPEGGPITGGSTLVEVVMTAVEAAHTWMARVGLAPGRLDVLRDYFDPNRKERR